MELSISTIICAEKKLEEGLSLLKKSGFNTVEISREHLDISQAYSLIDKLGIKVWSVHGISGYKLLSNKIIRNHKELKPLLENYSDKIKTVYVGHKNVPSRIDAHRLKKDIWNWKYRLGQDCKQCNFVL